MVTSLGKLQSTVIKQEKEIAELKDSNFDLEESNKLLKLQYEQLKKTFNSQIEKKVTKSVKKAVDELKKEYDKIMSEKDQRIFELECRLNINSSNSSLPSSKNPIYTPKICNSRKKTNLKQGGQNGHLKHQLKKFNDNEITEYVDHKEEKCKNCGSKNIKEIDVKERDEYEVKVTVKRKRHKFYVYQCLDCGKIFNSKIPLELHAENQYGAGVKTLAMTLLNYGLVSYNRTRKIICGLTNGEIDPTEGYLIKLQKKASDKLKNFIFDIKEKIVKSSLVYWDDTCIKIGEKDRACLRVYTNELYVLYFAHMSKDVNGMNEDGILQNLSSDCKVMHDHLLHNYSKDYKYKNLECNSHVNRKLKGITENTNHKWSDELEELLESTLEKRKELLRENEKLSDDLKINSFDNDFINSFNKKYDQIIEKGFKEYIEFKHKYEFEREENLLEFLRDYKLSITAWIYDFSLPYSNNLSESLLRMLKTKMKVSYQFKNLKYAEFFANIISYTETCGKFGINKCTALKRLFEGVPYSVEELEKIVEEKQPLVK